MDTALRNRLTGAVILVLLAVLLLPELLTGSGRAPAPALAVAAGDGPPRQTVQIDLTDSAAAPAGVAPSAAAPTPIPSLKPADEPVELPVPPAAVASAETATPSVAAPSVAAPPLVARPPATVAVTPAPAAPAASTNAADGRRYFVQVGTFATRERAEVLRSDLARRGFEVGINETDRDDKRFFRVRVGPMADRKAAEAMETRLRPLAPDRAIVAVP